MRMTDLQSEILETVAPGSMTKEAIVEQVDDDFPDVEVKSELASLLVDGDLKEHPEIEGVYRVAE